MSCCTTLAPPEQSLGHLDRRTALAGLAGAVTLAGRAPEDLSPRDVEILRCLVLGLPNKAIAQQFKLSEATIKVHVRHLLRKIGAENRTQAAVWAIARGLAARPSGSPAAGDSSSETRPSETKTVRRHLMPVPVVAPR